MSFYRGKNFKASHCSFLLRWLALKICVIPQTSQTIDYAYTNTNWKDRLTEYDGQAITYDRIGNPLTYRDGMTMTWKRGRQLTTLQTAENNIQYKYDSDSIRTSKIVDGVVYTYEYLGGLLMHETRGEQAYDYYYDANGQLYAVSYKLSENDTKKVYYFTHNWRGDIVGIYNGNGDLKATYSYDAWGNVTAIEDANGNAITSATHIANLNPFRYRGYYQDTETGLYYLLSRYYDPVTHRFVNADGYFQSGGSLLDSNMNAYCRNNPVNYYDPTGTIVFSVGVSGDAVLFFGEYLSYNLVFDTKGNAEIQKSKIDYSQGDAYFGVFHIGAALSFTVIWETDTVTDYNERYSETLGGSVGSFGIDVVGLEDYEDIAGVGGSLGVGYGIDFAHVYKTTTETLWMNNAQKSQTNTKQNNITTNVKSNTRSVKRCCRYCGRPIGTKSWECRGGWS